MPDVFETLKELEIDSGYVLYLHIEDEDLGAHRHYDFSISMPNSENAGYDLLTAETWSSFMGEKAHLLKLGVRAMMLDIETRKPVHYWLLPRSSIYKTGHIMANSVGVIDSSYRGLLCAPVVRTVIDAQGFQRHDRHFQIVAPDMRQIKLVARVTSLPSSERGEGGFGSTGN